MYTKEIALEWSIYLDGISARNSSPEGQSFSLYTAESPLADLVLSDDKKKYIYIHIHIYNSSDY